MRACNWMMTLGLGAAMGAVAVMMMPSRSPLREAADRAAENLEDTISGTVRAVERKLDM